MYYYPVGLFYYTNRDPPRMDYVEQRNLLETKLVKENAEKPLTEPIDMKVSQVKLMCD